MNSPESQRIFRETVSALSKTAPEENRMIRATASPLPSTEALHEIMDCMRMLVFPAFYDSRPTFRSIREAVIGVNLEKLYTTLAREIIHGLQFDRRTTCQDADSISSKLATEFLKELPEVKRLLYTDVTAMFDNDPAADDFGEIILSYPVVDAMLHYRTAHALLKLGIPVIPRMLTEMAHSSTGIDINPGAKIGEYFAIDHGTGVVIGQTAIIGKHVTLYQGVTLGAKNFTLDQEGHPVNVPRHPIIEDNVTIYSNSSILGRITVGHDTIIGGNVWLTHSVPPNSKILQTQ